MRAVAGCTALYFERKCHCLSSSVPGFTEDLIASTAAPKSKLPKWQTSDGHHKTKSLAYYPILAALARVWRRGTAKSCVRNSPNPLRGGPCLLYCKKTKAKEQFCYFTNTSNHVGRRMSTIRPSRRSLRLVRSTI